MRDRCRPQEDNPVANGYVVTVWFKTHPAQLTYINSRPVAAN
jgi:hypothetical protein